MQDSFELLRSNHASRTSIQGVCTGWRLLRRFGPIVVGILLTFIVIYRFSVNSCPGGSSDTPSNTPRSARESSVPSTGAGQHLN